MPGFEDIGVAVGRIANWYEAHPIFGAMINTGLIYAGTAGLGIAAHQNDLHDLERVLDATNIIATGAYSMNRASHLLPRGYSRDILRAGIAAGMAYGLIGEARDFAFNYDAPDLASKILESLPIIARSEPKLESIGAAIFGIGYLIGQGRRGYTRTRRPAARHARAHH